MEITVERTNIDFMETSAVGEEEDRRHRTGHVGSSASMALVRTMLGGTAALQLLSALAHVHTEGKTTIVRLKIDCKEQNRMEWDSLIFLFVRMER